MRKEYKVVKEAEGALIRFVFYMMIIHFISYS